MPEAESDSRCRRCGTCCEKGGPALHQEDRHLVESGILPARDLFTLRRGELARDNVKGELKPLAGEIIKIKGHGGRWTCRYYDREQRGCGLYDHRPLECRALDCRDTRRIEAVYATRRLTRQDVLATVAGVWEMVEEHEARCAYDRLGDRVGRGMDPATRRLTAERDVLEMMRYDTELRRLAVEKGGMDAGMLDFIFGRPLSQTIVMYNLKLEKTNNGYRLTPTAAFVDPKTGEQRRSG